MRYEQYSRWKYGGIQNNLFFPQSEVPKPTLTPLKRKAAAHPSQPIPKVVALSGSPVLLNSKLTPVAGKKTTTIKSTMQTIRKSTNNGPTKPIIINTATAPTPSQQPSVARNVRNASASGTPRILNIGSNTAALQAKPKASSIEVKPRAKSNNTDDDDLDYVLPIAGEYLDDEEPNDTSTADAADQTGCFPCPECKRNFALPQLLDMHMQKHKRDRNAECAVCHKRFFTKSDLNKHYVVHTGDKRFMCTVCPQGFSRANLLERHMQQHADLLQHSCCYCQKQFISAEECALHEEKHKIVRKFKCGHCDKSFAFKQGLDRHETVHAKKQPFPCSYCPQGFSTSSKLTRHLTEHAGDRPFPCRSCNKSFLMSHHLSRHMRTHQGALVMSLGAGGQLYEGSKKKRGKRTTVKASTTAAVEKLMADAMEEERLEESDEEMDTSLAATLYECLACDRTFAENAELMEHSEEHAMESGVCPFCKTELEGEQAIGEHMRQHGEQQFACEFCDLMFAMEEMKEEHCQLEHADEQEVYANDARARAANAAVTNGEEKDGGGGEELEEHEVLEYQEADGELVFMEGGDEVVQEYVIGGTYVDGSGGHLVEITPEKPATAGTPPAGRRQTTRGQKAVATDSQPKILNNAAKNATAGKKGNAIDAADIDDMKFEFVDIIKTPEPKTPVAAGKSPSKASPTKQIPVAQHRFEQQLKDAMKQTVPKAEATTAAAAKPTTTTPLTKTLPSGVTLKKVVINRSASGSATTTPSPKQRTEAAKVPTASASSAAGRPAQLRRVDAPPATKPQATAAKATAVASKTPPTNRSQRSTTTTAVPIAPLATKRKLPTTTATSPSAAPAAKTTAAAASKQQQVVVRRVEMTQTQMDKMAREGKLQIVDGQVFLRDD